MIQRRRFLQTATAAAVATAVPSTALAIDPIKRNGLSKFKFSLAAYSYRSLLSGKTPKLSMFQFIDECADMGLEGTELTSYYFKKPTTEKYIRALKQHAFRLGLDVSGTAVGNDFGKTGEAYKAAIKHVKQWVDYAEILGAPVIRIFAGHHQKDVPLKKSHAQMVAAMEECCDYAGQHGVHLALENHGGPTSTAKGLMQFVKDVKSPWFGVNLDTGNFHSKDVYKELAEVAPYALNVQIKVVVSGPDRKKQPADFKKLAKIMRDVRYRGYIVLEYEEGGDPRMPSRKYIHALKEAFLA